MYCLKLGVFSLSNTKTKEADLFKLLASVLSRKDPLLALKKMLMEEDRLLPRGARCLFHSLGQCPSPSWPVDGTLPL